MKTNIKNVDFFCACMTIISVIAGGMDTAFAQQNNVPSINQSVLNGLYSPTASERFFEEGKRKIKRETDILPKNLGLKPRPYRTAFYYRSYLCFILAIVHKC
ncbi:MAG: hypothetical protein MJK14_00760 [Rivularia sp. ALOHA_DT_140]|nr:hypothetical protein [Rivularia sp. ALOHA_DT_140]